MLMEEMENTETSLERLLRYSEMVNITDEIDDDTLIKIGKSVCKGVKDDEASRDDWKKKSEAGMKLALQVCEDKTFPWKNASNVKYPLVTVSALQFHARAYPSIVNGNKIVKGQITGEDKDGQKMKQAERVSNYMNYQLLEEMEEWDEQMDKMLLALPIEGCEFKKTYYDNTLGRNVSEWIRPIDFIVNYKTKDLTTCPRQTHRLWFYPHEIEDKQRSEVWRDVDLKISVTDDEEEKLQEFYEQHLLFDLDDDGYKEPYCVTVHKDTEKVVRIKASYYEDNIFIKYNGTVGNVSEIKKQVIAENNQQAQMDAMQYMDMANQMLRSGMMPPEYQPMIYPEFQPSDAEKIVRIERNRYFTKYPFIPAPDGGFYDIGFGQLIGPLSDTVDTTINQLINSGTLATTQAGFVREGVSINGRRGDVSFKMGEFKSIKTPSGMPIGDSVLPFNFKEPSLVLFNLLGFLVQGVKDITGVQDILTGGPQQNETATTTIARIEQGMQVFTAVYKRIFRSMKKEFKKLYKLNSVYLKPEVYFRVLDSGEQGVVSLSDFKNDGTDIQPVADPSVSTTFQKIARAEMLMNLKGDPGLNPDEINKRFLEATGTPNIDALIVPQEKRQPPPDPKLMELQLKAMAEQRNAAQAKAEIFKTYAEAIDKIASADAKQRGVLVEEYEAQLKGIKAFIEASDEQGRTAEMEVGSGDEGSIQEAGEIESGMPAGELISGGLQEPEPELNGIQGGVS